MTRYLPLSYGALLLGLVSASTYVLCSAEALNGAALYLMR